MSVIEEPIIKTPSHRLHSHSHFDLTFTIDDGKTPVRLTLEPNHDILHDDFSVSYIGHDGQIREVEPVARHTQKVYRGRAFTQKPGRNGWSQAGWARITVRSDGKNPTFEGAYRIYGDAHHIQTATHYRKQKHQLDPDIPTAADGGQEFMVVTRDSDIIQDPFAETELKRSAAGDESCGSDALGFNSRYDLEMRSLEDRSLYSTGTKSLFGRQSIDGDVGDDAGANYIPDIGSTTGCPGTRKVALVGIATDCTYFEDFDEDREEIRNNVIDMVNRASGLYEDTFNISLGITNLTLIDQTCKDGDSETTPWNLPCSKDVTLNDRLNLFSEWRGRSEDKNAYWSLLTTCNTKSAVGLAWRGMLCRKGASDAQDSRGKNETVAATNVVVRGPAEWQIFAHETGHTFGAVHDCTSRECPVDSNSQSCCPLSSSTCDAAGEFIMNPSTGQRITEFSACSIGNICSGLRRNVDGECLTDNRNIGTITGSQCGNGIVEEGEDCDCGGADSCDESDCCNGETCKFRDGAQCDPINEDCCTDQCKFSSQGTVCRESSGDCDPEEKCSGDSGSCPRNANLDDGDSCGDGLKCASGQCTSRDEQCRSMLQNADNVKGCGGDTCIMSCESSRNDGVCSQYNQNFLDGTDCGGGGRCDNGMCRGSSTWGRIKEWFRDNKQIAIPVGAVLAGMVVLGLSCCLFSSCRRRRRAKKQRAAKPPVAMSGGNSHSVHPRAAAHGANGGYWQSNNDFDGYNGGYGAPPSAPANPPPAYIYGEVQDQPRNWRRSSMRYA